MAKIDRSEANLYDRPAGSFIRNRRYVYVNTSNTYVPASARKDKGGRGYTGHASVGIGVLQDPEHPEVRRFYGNTAYQAMLQEQQLGQYVTPQSDAFEDQPAAKDLHLPDALRMLDCAAYLDLLQIPDPFSAAEIALHLLKDGILYRQENGLYGITNMGAILFAKRLSAFPTVSRKAIRVIRYAGDSRLTMLKEYESKKGYAAGMEALEEYLWALLPTKFDTDGAFREKKTAYPETAVQEVLVNALIHQDFTISGASPTVEVFDSRLEITNPGTLLADQKRIAEDPPKPRNVRLAALMRRLELAGEPGTGWDEIKRSCADRHLQEPRIAAYPESTKVTLFPQISF